MTIDTVPVYVRNGERKNGKQEEEEEEKNRREVKEKRRDLK